MYIRRTTTKSRQTGEPYYTYRLVESFRTEKGVRQRTLLNLGRQFEVPRELWATLSQRIEQLIRGQADLFALDLDAEWESAAQRVAALVIRAQARQSDPDGSVEPDYQTVDIESLDVLRPRSIGIEHVALSALHQVALDSKLESLGMTRPQRCAAIGTIIGRMVAPGSELATHAWLQERTGLGELMEHDFGTTSLTRLYRVADALFQHKDALEAHLYRHEQSLFDFDDTITLYDLTNTYFEGRGKRNENAAFGRSKEKRADCPLVTLAMVLDGSGFPKKSEVFAGNASEPKTLDKMLQKLVPGAQAPTVVLDAGIATEDNIAWLVANGYRYIVVSRQRYRAFDADQAVLIKDQGDLRIRIQRVVHPDTGEIKLYCHSSQREKKDHSIQALYAKRFESALEKLAQGLHKPRTVKQYDKVLQRLGRLKQRYARAAQHYDITVEQDETTGKAISIQWTRKTSIEDTQPGVYCLRANQYQWDEATLWHTYTMLTDLEAVFRSLKSELGLRPVFHQKTDRVSAHLFISVLAYHLVHTLRYQLKSHKIHLSWDGLRRQLAGQDRVTVTLKQQDGRTLHVRKTTRAEPRQQHIYTALGIPHRPGKTEKTII